MSATLSGRLHQRRPNDCLPQDRVSHEKQRRHQQADVERKRNQREEWPRSRAHSGEGEDPVEQRPNTELRAHGRQNHPFLLGQPERGDELIEQTAEEPDEGDPDQRAAHKLVHASSLGHLWNPAATSTTWRTKVPFSTARTSILLPSGLKIGSHTMSNQGLHGRPSMAMAKRPSCSTLAASASAVGREHRIPDHVEGLGPRSVVHRHPPTALGIEPWQPPEIRRGQRPAAAPDRRRTRTTPDRPPPPTTHRSSWSQRRRSGCRLDSAAGSTSA